MDQELLTKRHMRFTMQLISKFGIIATLLILSGCATRYEEPERIEIPNPGPKVQAYSSPYLDVWRAALITVGKYSLKSYDEDSGTIETDFIKGEEAWNPPHKKKYIRGGYRYKINVRVIKGPGKNSAKVIILKQPEIQKDFFSGSEKITTDGLEEAAILYRIERELALGKALSKIKRN